MARSTRFKDLNRHWTLRAQESIAQEKLTNSKRRSVFVDGVYPTHIQRGAGAYLYDLEGNRYIDYICALGSNLFGYCAAAVELPLIHQLKKGITHSLATDLEVETAEKLKELFPYVDLVKFTKTGTDACAAAIKIARAANPTRQLVLSQGYHGWSDEFVSLTPPAHGVANKYNIKKLNDHYFMEDLIEAACVIIEPIVTDNSRERIEWLRKLRDDCTKTKTILIFDEVITGLRYKKLSVANAYDVRPDITVFGKAFGGGLPIGIVAGKREIMNSAEYFISGTFFGETLSLAVAKSLMTDMQTNMYNVQELWDKANDFQAEFNSISDKIQLEGYGTRSALVGDLINKALFMQEACKAGYLVGPSFFIGFQNLIYLEQTLSSFRDIINNFANVKLEGTLPESPFAQKQREKS